MRLTLIFGKIIIFLLKILGFSGTALPGLIILKIRPHFLENTIGVHPEKIILVTGTNGKTTTSHLLAHMLSVLKKRVFLNAEGSNMERGIASAVIAAAEVREKPLEKFDFYILEADEGNFPALLMKLKPKQVILLNLFRDQLDRYGEINTLSSRWQEILQNSPPALLVFNADDPNVTFAAEKVAGAVPFTVNLLNHNRVDNPDQVFCPVCGEPLAGHYQCAQCGFKKPNSDYQLTEISLGLEKTRIPELRFNGESIGLPPFGKYNYWNIAASLTLVNLLFKENLVLKPKDLLIGFQPAFGRFEKILYKNNFFYVILAKNPSGWNNVLTSLSDFAVDNLLFGLNDKIADGEDVSWIYDVDFERLNFWRFKPADETIKKVLKGQKSKIKKTELLISGRRAFDLALRLKIAEVLPKNAVIEPIFSKGVDVFLERVAKHQTSVIVLTYTCLLELEKILFKKKLIKRKMGGREI